MAENEMPKWTITIETHEKKIYEWTATDLREIRGDKGLIVLKKQWFEKLVDNLKNLKIEGTKTTIRSLSDPEGNDVSGKRYYFILTRFGLDQVPLGFLIGLTKEQGILVAVWPEGLAELTKKNQGLLESILISFVETPAHFDDLLISTTKSRSRD